MQSASVCSRGAARYIADKERRDNKSTKVSVNRVICCSVLTIKRSSDKEQVVRDKHSALRACLDGAGGIGALSVHRVSRVHCSTGMCQSPYTARPPPKMHQATRACGPRSEMVPRASLSEELSQRRVLKWRRRSGVWAGEDWVCCLAEGREIGSVA